jgi:hypothetical protein
MEMPQASTESGEYATMNSKEIMGSTPQFYKTGIHSWANWHQTFVQSVDELYELQNADTGDVPTDYNAMTAAIQQFLSKARAEQKRVRALGGGWSFTKVAATEGYILDTKQLNMVSLVSSASVDNSYNGDSRQLLFAQCGNSIYELNKLLRQMGRSLKTSGASNGQSIVGSFSTNTHGAAIDFGSTPDYVVGLHIIVSPDRHIWLERAGYPVVTESFVQKLGATMVRDDELFYSALVSFGSFGFIHGVMVETEPLFLLESYRRLVPLSEVKAVMDNLDFTGIQFLAYPGERPFHFQVVVNPYDSGKGAYVIFMYKRPFRSNYPPFPIDPNKAGPGDDAAMVLARITDIAPGITPLVVNQTMKTSYTPYEQAWGTLGEIFPTTNLRGKLASAAMAIPAAYTNQLNQLLLDVNQRSGPFAGVFSYRYVKGTKATLGFTHFDQTCVAELDAVDSHHTRNFYQEVWAEMDRQQIPYKFHWGKLHNLNRERVISLYGFEKVNRWINGRNHLLGDSLPLFNNEMLADLGLDTVLPSLRFV